MMIICRRVAASPCRVVRYQRSFATAGAADRLGLGGYQWSQGPHGMDENKKARYNEVVQTAISVGVRTLEAGPDGGDASLATVLKNVLDNDGQEDTVVECLWRVGYRTVVPPAAGDEIYDAELQRAVFQGDIVLEDGSGSGNIEAKETSENATSSTVVYNLSPDYLAYELSQSPLMKLRDERPDQVRISVLLHNPEVLIPHGHSSDDVASVLKKSVQHLRNTPHVDSIGVVSNGLSLPLDHPMRLDWTKIQPQVDVDIVQLPLNLLEPDGAAMLNNIHEGTRVYGLRPFKAYPPSSKTAYSRLLADCKIPGDNVWTHERVEAPSVYQAALATALAHFDAEELVTDEGGEEDTEEAMQRRESLQGCRLLQSMLHDLDQDLGSVPSYQAFQDQLLSRIVPLLRDTFESYDDDTGKVLQTFFVAYGFAVKHSVARHIRTNDTKDFVGENERLQEAALRYLWDLGKVDKIVVGASSPDQITDTANIAQQLQERK